MPERSFLGTGMKFPPQINPATGRFAVSSEEESVKESVYLILMTQKPERFLRPQFGSDLMSYTFMDINITSVNMMVRSLTEQILSNEPRIQSVTITTDEQVREGCLLVNIDYVIKSSQEEDRLTVPFYLNAAPEEEAYEPELYETEPFE